MTFALTGFEGKVAVVTGAGRMRSIGRAVAVGLARAGCDVVVTGTGRDPETYPEDERAAGWADIESVAAEIEARGGRALPLVADVATEEGVAATFDRVLDRFGRVDVLVNNAAASRGGDRVPAVDLGTEAWDRVIAVNLRGAFLMSRAFARHCVDQGRSGAIVNVSSIGGKLGGPGTAAYSASKAGLQSLTSSMAKELGCHGVRVNAICPGVIATSRLDDWSDDQWDAYVRAQVPMQRVGSPGEIADVAVFLASDQASFVTGQSWNVDGGQLTIR
ncbi:3-oxoacyl-ACP reductase family protein [Nocardioides sp. YIM 152315]|uniref:SDR family NAD(P)-dependent oxidoreductase n=1 Tax=Nocardioides sp. YIM 152315 TaxID=3031760 RepID=UPI0023DB7C2B|nr:3-oxoacyl-ACP reductase family protein [Nocardioides sp. YIM 152315]MDF1604726.1 3-oxoacyl-ACP reductase FabG [Nocardioides sp. YIM 152315]